MQSLPPFRLSLLAPPALTTRDGAEVTGRAVQRHRLALLALLARAPETGVARDVLLGLLWPEGDGDRVRNLLNVSVYVIRQALGESAIVSTGNALRLSTTTVEVDVVRFESALDAGDAERAVREYRGAFLDGFFLPDAPEFGHWVDRERARLAQRYAGALEALAEAAEVRDDWTAAVAWWTARTNHDPYDSRVATRLMLALAGSGNRGGALRHAEQHQRLLRDELELEPAPDIAALVERLRHEPAHAPPPVMPRETTVPVPRDAAPPPADPTRRPRRRAIAVLAAVPLTIAAVISGRLATHPPSPASVDAPGTDGLPTRSPAAWELYRRASQQELLRSDDGARDALAMLRRSVELDPSFAAGHAGLARLYLRVGPREQPDMRRRDRLELAARHAALATQLGPTLAEAHAVLGLTDMLRYRLTDAEARLVRARELAPDDGRIREWLIGLYIREGRAEEALAEATALLERDPLSSTAIAELAHALVANGRCPEARRVIEPLGELSPPLLRVGSIMARCDAELGSWARAAQATSTASEVSGGHARAVHAYYLARSGRDEDAEAALEALRSRSERTGEDAFDVATVLAGLGRTDEALPWIERSIEDYSFSSDVTEPAFTALSADPRFASLLTRVGLPTSRGR